MLWNNHLALLRCSAFLARHIESLILCINASFAKLKKSESNPRSQYSVFMMLNTLPQKLTDYLFVRCRVCYVGFNVLFPRNNVSLDEQNKTIKVIIFKRKTFLSFFLLYE